MKRPRRRWAARARAILRLAFPVIVLILATGGASLNAQPDSVRITHRFVVPDSTIKISPMLPAVSEYPMSADYDRWWHEIAYCEGLWLPPDYARVRYFQVNAEHFYDKDHPQLFEKAGVVYVYWAVGTTFIYESLIFIALSHRDEELVIKHEMLHLLIFWNGVPTGRNGHPMPFYGRCGMSVIYHAPPPRS